MVNVILAPNDQDKELYQKLSETAAAQNIPIITFQRNILCDIFNIPKDYDSNAIYHLLNEILYKRSLEQNIPVKSVVRSCFRDYFGLVMPRAKLLYEKKGWPLQQREKRFQVLGFLVTVDAATRQEIADQLKTTKKSIEGVLNFNKHYFESFRIPYDKHYQWRATEKGKQDYFAIVDEVETVRESNLEKVNEAEKAAERKRKFELMEQKRTELEKTAIITRTRHTKPTEEAKTGIEKYFTPDPTNPIDAEIVRRLNALGRGVSSQEERYCKTILSKRLYVGANTGFHGIDQIIENMLLERCKQRGITRNELIREQFCTHFNIKIKEA